MSITIHLVQTSKLWPSFSILLFVRPQALLQQAQGNRQRFTMKLPVPLVFGSAILAFQVQAFSSSSLAGRQLPAPECRETCTSLFRADDVCLNHLRAAQFTIIVNRTASTTELKGVFVSTRCNPMCRSVFRHGQRD